MCAANVGKEKIGFIGLGLMGHGMAKNIVEKGFPLTVVGHRNRAPVDDVVSRGASEAKDVRGTSRVSLESRRSVRLRA